MNESVKNLQVTGSMAVGRRMTLSGELRVGGPVRLRHNVKIEGWLDAPNQRFAAKGLFLTLEELEEAFPEPRPGFWALVGDKLPAMLYVARGRRWVSTGNRTGEPMVVQWSDGDGASGSGSDDPAAGQECACRSELDALDLRVERAEEESANALKRSLAAEILPFDGFNPFRAGMRPTKGVWFVPSRGDLKGNFWVASSEYGLTNEDYNDIDAGPAEAELAPARTDHLYRCADKIYRYEDGELQVVASAPEVMGSTEEIQALITSGDAVKGQIYCVVDPATRMVNALYLG